MATESQLVETFYGDHVVHFYGRDDELIERVGRYVQGAMAADATALVVATPGHRRGLESWLGAHGLDPATVGAAGLLHLVDAQDTLDRIFDGERPDGARFREVVGGLIRQAGTGGRAVYVYGEMVAELWARGLVAATMALEALWNELSKELEFSLFSGYPAAAIADDTDGRTLAELGAMHSALIWAPPPFAAAAGGVAQRSRAFPHQADSPRAARHFVMETLQAGGAPPDLVDDAGLVVTELTTNALLHAQSGTMVTLALTRDAVFLAVQDHLTILPARRPAADLEPSGRGLELVAAVSRRWGADFLAGGKVVWAELRR